MRTLFLQENLTVCITFKNVHPLKNKVCTFKTFLFIYLEKERERMRCACVCIQVGGKGRQRERENPKLTPVEQGAPCRTGSHDLRSRPT